MRPNAPQFSPLWIAGAIAVLVFMVLAADARPWLRGNPNSGLTIAVVFNVLLVMGVAVFVLRRLRRGR